MQNLSLLKISRSKLIKTRQRILSKSRLKTPAASILKTLSKEIATIYCKYTYLTIHKKFYIMSYSIVPKIEDANSGCIQTEDSIEDLKDHADTL